MKSNVLLSVLMTIVGMITGNYNDVSVTDYEAVIVSEEQNISTMMFCAEKENPTDDEMDIVETIFQTRLITSGYTEARITRVDDKNIAVSYYESAEFEDIITLLEKPACMTFRDADGTVILDGKEDIVKVEYQYRSAAETLPAESYIQIEITDDGAKKMAVATKSASEQGAEGKNFIGIYLDDELISAPMVNEEIDSNIVVISGGFTPESAQTLVNQINSGMLPFKMKCINTK